MVATRAGVFRLICLVALLAGAWTACLAIKSRQRPEWSTRTNRLRVLTTIFPLYDFARAIGGDSVEVRCLLPPGVDPHEYALTPGDVRLVAGADILIANGRGLDDFLLEALRKAGAATVRPVMCADGLPTIELEAGDEHGHSHGPGDPHLWLDPVLARRYAAKISSEIAGRLRSAGRDTDADGVEARAKAFDVELAALDADYRRDLAGVRGRSFGALHTAFGYLAARYGLRMAAVWEPSPGREPGPRDVARLVEMAKSRQISVFFSEPGFSPRALEMIAADARLPIRELDPLETATDYESTRYLDTMRRNLGMLRECLEKPGTLRVRP